MDPNPVAAIVGIIVWLLLVAGIYKILLALVKLSDR